MSFTSLILASLLAVVAGHAAGLAPIEQVDTRIGAEERGYCVPGACLPQASINPSPDTLAVPPSGYDKRMKSGFSTLAFAYGDWCRVAVAFEHHAHASVPVEVWW